MIFVEAYKIIVLRGNTHAYNLTGIYKGYDLGTQKVTFIWIQVADSADLWEDMLSEQTHLETDTAIDVWPHVLSLPNSVPLLSSQLHKM